jgi:hypothetical protein
MFAPKMKKSLSLLILHVKSVRAQILVAKKIMLILTYLQSQKVWM